MSIMLKYIVCSVFLSLMLQANAQLSKGSIFLGGNLYFSSIKYDLYVPQDDTKKIISTSLIPFIGKAINDNTIVGIGLNYSFNNTDNIGRTTAQKTRSYGGDVFLRKYKTIGRGFSLFGQGNLGGGFEETTYYRDLETENINGPGISLNIYPGLSYTISKKLQLETAFNRLLDIGYSREKHTVTSIDHVTTQKFTASYFNVSTSLENLLGFTLGFRFLLSKKTAGI